MKSALLPFFGHRPGFQLAAFLHVLFYEPLALEKSDEVEGLMMLEVQIFQVEPFCMMIISFFGQKFSSHTERNRYTRIYLETSARVFLQFLGVSVLFLGVQGNSLTKDVSTSCNLQETCGHETLSFFLVFEPRSIIYFTISEQS